MPDKSRKRTDQKPDSVSLQVENSLCAAVEKILQQQGIFPTILRGEGYDTFSVRSAQLTQLRSAITIATAAAKNKKKS
jgi:hypothetical protein